MAAEKDSKPDTTEHIDDGSSDAYEPPEECEESETESFLEAGLSDDEITRGRKRSKVDLLGSIPRTPFSRPQAIQVVRYRQKNTATARNVPCTADRSPSTPSPVLGSEQGVGSSKGNAPGRKMADFPQQQHAFIRAVAWRFVDLARFHVPWPDEDGYSRMIDNLAKQVAEKIPDIVPCELTNAHRRYVSNLGNLRKKSELQLTN